MKNLTFPTITLAATLIIAALIVSNAAGKFSSQNRYVSVKGLSQKEVEADKVIWPILYKEAGNSLNEISISLAKKEQIIKKFLIENGIKEEEISNSAPEIIDYKTERYAPERNENRYNVTNVITVVTSQVELTRELLTRTNDLLAQGVVLSSGDYRYNISYEYTALNDIKVEMIKEASANAKASALQFANDSNSKLGKIKNATQGQISISDLNPNMPYIKRIRVVTSISYFLND
ncbi:MAG: SIMPL domain-containing protein [Rikenellaceae bacterium]